MRARALQRDIKVHDLELMLDERPAGLAVLAAPFDIGEIDAVALDQEPGAAIGKRIGHRRRAGGRIVVELRPRPIDIAGVEKPVEAISWCDRASGRPARRYGSIARSDAAPTAARWQRRRRSDERPAVPTHGETAAGASPIDDAMDAMSQR